MTARRLLHPGAWWLWATGLGVCALRTTNPLLLALIIAVAGWVVVSRRPNAPWSRSFASSLRLGAVVIVVRIVFQIIFGARVDGQVLFTLPSVALPSWAAGVAIGGPVTIEAIIGAFYQGLRLATVLACVGAATALCSPYRMLRALPSALHEAGVAMTVALTFAPQTVVAARRVREARRLRGRSDRGPRAWTASAMPVLESALERSVALAASMDGRGYGRRGNATVGRRRVGAALTLVGIALLAVGAYGLLDPGAPVAFRLPAMVLAAAVLLTSSTLARRGDARSRYRPDPWALPEWIVAATGFAAVVGSVLSGGSAGALHPSVSPLEWPTVPIAASIGVLLGALPAWFAPMPPVATSAEMVVAA